MDFFVNDMLDYAVLMKTESAFVKKNENFDIREAIEEIEQVLNGKIKMKKLVVDKVFENFQGGNGQSNFIVRTDKMRM